MKTDEYACNTGGNAKVFSAHFYQRVFFQDFIYQDFSYLPWYIRRENSELSKQISMCLSPEALMQLKTALA